MSRILMIGAGGVATVAAFKMAQNTDVFTELMIASHHKAKCDRLVEAIHAKGYKMNIKTAEVDADDVSSSRRSSMTINPSWLLIFHCLIKTSLSWKLA